MRKLLGLWGLILLLLVPVSSWAKVPAAFRSDIAALGMGGAFVAAGDRAGAMFYNPALLSKVRFDLSIPSLRLEMDTDLVDMLNFVGDNQEKFVKFDSLTYQERQEFLNDVAKYDDLWMATRVSPLLNLVIAHIGVAAYNVTDIKLKVDKGIYTPRVMADVRSDIVYAIGYGGKFPMVDTPGLKLGALVKVINRSESGSIKISAADLGNTEDIIQEALDSLSTPKVGFGLDVGALYKASPVLDVGVVFQDLIAGIEGDWPPINFKVGLAYRPLAAIPLLPLAKSILLAADVEDLFNYEGNSFFNKVHLGAQLKLPFFPFTFRAGINQGYPTLGLGLNLLLIKVDYAYYSQELGDAPGVVRDSNHALQIKVGW